MAIPDRRGSASVLLELDPPAWFLRHVAAVAEIGAFLAGRIRDRGGTIDRGLVEAAALLHDVDKLLHPDHPLRRLGHGPAGAAWLTERGYPELAGAVAHHPVTHLSAVLARGEERFASDEERVVSYADKRAGQRLVSLDDRFADWFSRAGEHEASLRAALPVARELERTVCEAAGVRPADVRRTRWVGGALVEARA